MIFMQALKKSTASPALQGIPRAHSTLAFRSTRRFGIASALSTKRSFVTESLSTLNDRPNVMSPSATAVAGAAARFPPGNPSTMAFLGLRCKSSGAAFRVQCDAIDEDVPIGNGVRVEDSARSVQEAWMVNLGRGDDEWLTGPRGGEWFTGVAPDVCPGELEFVT